MYVRHGILGFLPVEICTQDLHHCHSQLMRTEETKSRNLQYTERHSKSKNRTRRIYSDEHIWVDREAKCAPLTITQMIIIADSQWTQLYKIRHTHLQISNF